MAAANDVTPMEVRELVEQHVDAPKPRFSGRAQRVSVFAERRLQRMRPGQ